MTHPFLSSSRVLKKINSNTLATTFKLNLSDPRIIELLASTGIDAVWLCNEHVPNDWINLESQIRAARLHQIDTIIRVSKGSYSDYIKPFEAGATGIMVPHVSSADEAQQIIEWCRFHPLGRRPLDGGNIDGGFCNVPLSEYLYTMNHDRFIILQIESPEGLEQVEQIAALPGFDILLFGAGDFAHLTGHAGNLQHPEVVAARKRVGHAAKKFNKPAMSAGIPAPLHEMTADGYHVFNIGSDVRLLYLSALAAFNDFNSDAETSIPDYYTKP